MKVWQSRSGGHLCIKLDRGEEVADSIGAIAREKGILAASLNGLGALEDVEIAYFDVEKKVYEKSKLEGSWELLSITGNITIRDGVPFPHLHVVLSDRDCRVRGGHLVKGVVSVTAEIFLLPFPVPIHREMDDEIGLALMNR